MLLSELNAQVMVTKNLINLYGTFIALERPSAGWTTSPSGGQTRTGVPQTLPAVKRWFTHAATNDLQSATLAGDQSFVWGILLGLSGDDIRKGDTFTGPDGLKYEVRYVHSGTAAFETRAEVFSYES